MIEPNAPSVHGGAWRAWALAALLLASLAARAEAQCVGDCNDDQTVTINELILGVNIALGTNQVSACPSLDRNGNDGVEINELIVAVNNASGSCPVGPTATPTDVGGPTATPTEAPTGTATEDPTQTPTTAVTGAASPTPTPTEPAPACGPAPPNCGDGVVNTDQGETCDDNNREEGIGDSCPCDCTVALCGASEESLRMNAVFTTTNPELLLGGLTLFIPYPDGEVTVPGSNNDPAVTANVTSDVFAVTPNDQEYSLVAVLFDPLMIGYPSGTTAVSVNFQICSGGSSPPLSEFRCIVTDAIDLSFNTVTDQVSCELNFVQ